MDIDLDKKRFLFTCDVEYVGLDTDIGIDRIISMLAEFGVRGTFFCTYDVLRYFPNSIEKIMRAGHEIASHGYRHTWLGSDSSRIFLDVVSRDEAQDEVKRSKETFAKSGIEVNGFRAPAFRIGNIGLAEVRERFRYDASLIAGRPEKSEVVECDVNGFCRIPVTRLYILRIPFGSPYLMFAGGTSEFFVRRHLRRVNLAVYYCHSYDLMRVSVERPSLLKRLAYYRVCGSRQSYRFYRRVLSVAKAMGYHFSTCSEFLNEETARTRRQRELH